MKHHFSAPSKSCVTLSSILALGALPISSASPVTARNDNTSMIYDFEKLTPSTELRWAPCFDNFTCARLEVPLDYSDPSAGRTNIAYIKKSAQNESQSTENIILNPGGPGGSGVQLIMAAGDILTELLGPQFNLIGFDPRGVNNSGPSLDCFPGQQEAKARFGSTFQRPVDSKNLDSVVDQFEMAGAYGRWCSNVHKNSSARYANTPAVAADMLNFAEKQNVAYGRPAEEAKVWYFGISYGTLLGATFASLFPDRIGRMILDAVVDGEEYYHGVWVGNLLETDNAVRSFFKYCHEAGPDLCAFYSPTPAEIEDRLQKVVQDVRDHPIAVFDPSVTAFPRLATYEELNFILLSSLYSPLTYFPLLAQVLRDLENRNGSSLVQITSLTRPTADEPGAMILCMDAAGRYNLSTIEKWEQHIGLVNEESVYVGDSWSSIALVCRNMDIYPPESQQIHGVLSSNKTSFPILFVGNTVDPVTPLSFAKKMASLFPGSVALTQNSVGHGIISAASTCTAGYVRTYLVEGSLPPSNTTCEVETTPFIDASIAPVRRFRI
ncbi:hypothetical protein K469DRAFT_666450 [Zopfia rhizophila CBS 207.26]|uniref:Alpha/beta-hydrolase n=1 Tax=Zopfia rhizophila CBS 207.26 TaxID=1314779 RepID=A0A6A6E0Y3_9PEZI|nr:hypothetical protein K469DRAFT_666450 [Zopfia rhizophila CBS 207.26]